ncbi:ankyrin repeat domain-containing protein [Candidatus Pacearchaeota archaeon]|nr:ankyrin repeat domain-containing protein [Candidatus Pacearchaeota archaeon]
MNYDYNGFINVIKNNNIQRVKEYIKNGFDINTWDGYALRTAAEYGHLDIIKYFIEIGANIHIDNDIALRYASYQGYLGIVKYLVECGANIYAWYDRSLKLAAENGHFDVAKYLISCYKESELKKIFSQVNSFYVKFLILERLYEIH